MSVAVTFHRPRTPHYARVGQAVPERHSSKYMTLPFPSVFLVTVHDHLGFCNVHNTQSYLLQKSSDK